MSATIDFYPFSRFRSIPLDFRDGPRVARVDKARDKAYDKGSNQNVLRLIRRTAERTNRARSAAVAIAVR